MATIKINRNQVYTVKTVARLLGCGVGKVQNLVDAGELPGAYRLPPGSDDGKGSDQRRIPRACLRAYFRRHGIALPPELVGDPPALALIAGLTTGERSALTSFLAPLAIRFADSQFHAGMCATDLGPEDAALIDANCLEHSKSLAIVTTLRRRRPTLRIAAVPAEDDVRPEPWQAVGADRIFPRPLDLSLLAAFLIGEPPPVRTGRDRPRKRRARGTMAKTTAGPERFEAT